MLLKRIFVFCLIRQICTFEHAYHYGEVCFRKFFTKRAGSFAAEISFLEPNSVRALEPSQPRPQGLSPLRGTGEEGKGLGDEVGAELSDLVTSGVVQTF